MSAPSLTEQILHAEYDALLAIANNLAPSKEAKEEAEEKHLEELTEDKKLRKEQTSEQLITPQTIRTEVVVTQSSQPSSSQQPDAMSFSTPFDDHQLSFTISQPLPVMLVAV